MPKPLDITHDFVEFSVIPIDVQFLSALNFVTLENDSRDLNYAMEFLLSPQSDFNRTEQVLLIKLITEEEFKELNQEQVNNLIQIFNAKSVVLYFKSKSQESISIYWKSKNIDYFLRLETPKGMKNFECDKIHEFVADFLAQSLINNHLSTQQSLTHSFESNKIELNQLADSKNRNILQVSTEQGDTKCVKALLDLAIFEDTPYQSHNAPSLALNENHYDTLLVLMKANFTYPPFLDITKLPTDLQQFIQLCEDLHEAVITKNIPKIEEILKENPNLRHFYNKTNQSVLKVALEKKLYSMYEILLSNNITFGPHEDFARIFAGLTESDKTILRKIHFRCSKDLPEHHMNVLMMNTSISHDDMKKEGKEKLVLRAYRFLNKNPNLNPILKVVAASKRFNIIFDFKRKSVAAVDPSAPQSMRGSFYLNGEICVGAQQLLDPSTEHETFGTLAHELCHYAMNLTYKNFAKPYTKADRESKAEFKRIFEFCEANQGKEEIIDFAFKEPSKVQKAELIVRAAHLLAFYDNQPEKLAPLQELYADLFNFHTQKVIPVMNEAIPSIRRRADVEFKEKDKKISKMTRNFYIAIGLGIIIAALVGMIFYKPTYVFDDLPDKSQEKVRNAIVKYRNVNLQFNDLFGNKSDAYNKLTSDHITDMLNGVVLDFDDPLLYYLNEIVSFDWDGLPKKLKDKLMDLKTNFQGQSVKFKIFNATSPDAFSSLTSTQIIDILKDKKSFEIGQIPKLTTDFYLSRKFLPEDAKLLIFEYKVGHDFTPPTGSDPSGKINRFTEQRIKSKSFKRFCEEFFKQNSSVRGEIYKKIKQNSYFATQNYDLNLKDFIFMYEKSNNIIEMAEKEKIFVLSSEAGAGKTVAFEHLGIEIKEKYPNKWVSYVDLKSHVELYKYNYSRVSNSIKTKRSKRSIDVQKSQYFTIDIVLQLLYNIFDINLDKNQFEAKVLEDLFKSGNVVLIWNGFDEISPVYSDFVLNLINFINTKTSNVQYICTRPLYSDQLSKTFNTRPYQLVPLNGKEKNEFLEKFFTSKNMNSSDINKNIQMVEIIIKKLQTDEKPRQDFNTPLMLRLVAETCVDNLFMESGNTYGIYETFITKKIGIWIGKGETTHETIQKLILDSDKYNIIDLYQKYALLNEINLLTTTTLALKIQKLQIMQKKIPKDMTFDKISEMGILYINGKNKFEFAHKTFAEFFIARYFIKNIYNAPNELQEDEAELRLELFFKLVKSYGEKQTVITDFMGSYLANNKDRKDETFAPAISKLLRTKFRKFLFRLLDTNHPKIFEFLFKFFSKERDLLVELLHVHQNETFYTAIFNPSYFALVTNPEEIKNISKNYLSPSEYQKFINGVNQKGIFYYGLYFYEDVDAAKSHPEHGEFTKQFMYDNYWTFFQNIQSHLTEPEQKVMFTAAINPKIYLYYNRVTTFFHGFETFLYGYGDMWGRYEHLLSKNETKDALGDALVQYNEIFPGNKRGCEAMLTTLLNYIDDLSLDDSEIFEMFKSKNILHESHYFLYEFNTLWTYISNHTTMQQRKELLSQNDKDDKNIYLYSIFDDYKLAYSSNKYYYYIYDFTPFKVFHRAFTVPMSGTLNKTIEIYDQHFSKAEIQDLIMDSNDFLYYVVGSFDENDFQIFVDYLRNIFKGSETKLKEYLERNIKPTNLGIFEYVESFMDLPRAPADWFKNLNLLKKSLY